MNIDINYVIKAAADRLNTTIDRLDIDLMSSQQYPEYTTASSEYTEIYPTENEIFFVTHVFGRFNYNVTTCVTIEESIGGRPVFIKGSEIDIVPFSTFEINAFAERITIQSEDYYWHPLIVYFYRIKRKF